MWGAKGRTRESTSAWAEGSWATRGAMTDKGHPTLVARGHHAIAWSSYYSAPTFRVFDDLWKTQEHYFKWNQVNRRSIPTKICTTMRINAIEPTTEWTVWGIMLLPNSILFATIKSNPKPMKVPPVTCSTWWMDLFCIQSKFMHVF